MKRLFIIATLIAGCSTTVAPRDPAVSSPVTKASGPAGEPLLPDPEPTKGPVVHIHGDVDFTAQERMEVELAAEMWNLQTSGLAVATFDWDLDFSDEDNVQTHKDEGHHVLIRMSSTMSEVGRIDAKDDQTTIAWVSPSGGIHNPWRVPVVIKFVIDRMNGKFFQVTLHELGHVFGVPHVTTVSGLMFPAYIHHSHKCMKKADLSAFCAVNECGDAKLFPCE
jgi:hypothetical protein